MFDPASHTPSDDPDDDEVREVYAHYGLAMYAAQCVEATLVMLIIASKLDERSSFTKADHDALWESLWQRAMRARIKKTLKAVKLPDSVAADLDRVCDLRNALAHNFFFDHATSFLTNEGRAAMKAQLESARDEFFALDEQLTATYRALTRTHGITDEVVEQAMSEVLTATAEWPPRTGWAQRA